MNTRLCLQPLSSSGHRAAEPDSGVRQASAAAQPHVQLMCFLILAMLWVTVFRLALSFRDINISSSHRDTVGIRGDLSPPAPVRPKSNQPIAHV